MPQLPVEPDINSPQAIDIKVREADAVNHFYLFVMTGVINVGIKPSLPLLIVSLRYVNLDGTIASLRKQNTSC